MTGGLHIEITVFKLLGDNLNSSGWSKAATASGLALSGVADFVVRLSHLTRTKHAHQVTAASCTFCSTQPSHNTSLPMQIHL